MEETYRDCMRNHAASLGTYATDGCGEYTPDASSPTNLLCSACGCHRNFHRKVPSNLQYHHHQQHQQQPLFLSYPPGDVRAMEGRKRTRTKFSSEQKEKMRRFAEKIGWRIPWRGGDAADELGRFCREVGVNRHIFKVWMHNHKGSSTSSTTSSSAAAAAAAAAAANANFANDNADATMAATSNIASGSPSLEE